MKSKLGALGLGVCLPLLASGQTIDLKGVVQNSSGNPISGVVVKLKSNGLIGTTNTQGMFQISSTGLIRSQTSPATDLHSVYIQGEGVQFGQVTPGPIHLQVFDLAGTVQSDLHARLGAGHWQLSPGNLRSGIYFGRLETPDGVETFQFAELGSHANAGTPQPVSLDGGSFASRTMAATVDSLQASKALYANTSIPLPSLIDTAIVLTMDTAATTASASLPGDIASAAGTPLVAAHSMVRAIYKAYTGSLFQARRASDGKTQDIGPATAGGPVDLTTLKSFCSGTSCTVSMIYDQAGNGNDLPQATVANQMVLQYWTTASGAQVPKAVTVGSQYCRNRTSTKKIPTGAAAQTLYFVVDPKVYNAKCCWDYGNMELVAKVSSTNTGGKMNALNIGTSDNGYANPGAGAGPWGMVDYEAGVYSGSYRIGGGQVNSNNPSLTYPVATVLSKTNGTTSWVLKVGDATKGTLTTSWNGALPPGGYDPLYQEGGISLGEGGDGSKLGTGAFFEGVIVAGVTSDATDNAIQASMVSVFR